MDACKYLQREVLMKKARPLVRGFVGAVVGALAMVAYGLAWRMASQALGFGTIVFGFQNGGTSRLLDATGVCDAIAGAALGWATAEMVLSRGLSPQRRLDAASSASATAFGIAACVGFFGVFVLMCAVGPALAKLVSQFEAREFALQQFILTGVVANPKLWWCRAVMCRAAQAESVAEAELGQARTASEMDGTDAVTLSPA